MNDIYPRVYKYGPWTAALTGLCGLLFAGAGAALVLLAPKTNPAWLIPVIADGLAGAGVIVVLSLTCRLTLYEDRFEYRGLVATRRVARQDIVRTANVRHQTTGMSLTVVLKSGRKVKIGCPGRADEVFARWFDAFPNAQAEAEEAQGEALLANPAFGPDEAVRPAAILRDHRWLTWLSRAGWAAGMWGLIYPWPYPVCLMTLLALPAAAYGLVILSRGRWSLGDAKDGRLGIDGLAGLPAMGVGLRAMLDDGVVDWILAAVAGGVVALGLLLLVLAVEHRLKWGQMAVMMAVCYAYGWGGLIYLNMHFDNAPAKTYPVRVLSLETGEHGNPVKVTAWASRPSGNTVTVGDRDYRELKVGGTMCIFVFPGAARIPWYQYGPCK